jgi:hypothetical protein
MKQTVRMKQKGRVCGLFRFWGLFHVLFQEGVALTPLPKSFLVGIGKQIYFMKIWKRRKLPS